MTPRRLDAVVSIFMFTTVNIIMALALIFRGFDWLRFSVMFGSLILVYVHVRRFHRLPKKESSKWPGISP